ncbi:carbohydrate ABC transporter permease [Okibacterium endophyticum]
MNPSRRHPLAELAVVAALILTVLPIVWLLLLAFLPNRAIVQPLFVFDFWLGNFEDVFSDGVFPVQMLNSVQILVGTVAICIVFGSFAGYSLSKLRPPRWITLPSLLVAGFVPLIPPATLLPGFYALLGDLGILGTNVGLICLNAFVNLPFAVLLMSTYFSGIPEEIRESAIVDGASEWRAFFSIMVPLVRPGIAAVGVFVGIMAWNEFLMALTTTSGGTTAPLTVGIAGLLQPETITWGQLAAAGTAAAVPPIALAILANRQIVAGLTAGAVKG